MDIDYFVVRTSKEEHELIDDHFTIGIPEQLKLKIMALPKLKRRDFYNSVRKFMKHLEQVYSSETS